MSTDHAGKPRHVLRSTAVAAVATVALLATATGPASATAASRRAAATHAQSTTPPPKPLLTIEEQAEDIGDRVPGKGWPRIAADVKTIKTAWARFQARAKADGVAPTTIADFDSALDRLATAVKAKNGPDTSQGANDISRVTVELFGSYKLDAPVQVGRLDVIGRQIELDLECGQPRRRHPADRSRPARNGRPSAPMSRHAARQFRPRSTRPSMRSAKHNAPATPGSCTQRPGCCSSSSTRLEELLADDRPRRPSFRPPDRDHLAGWMFWLRWNRLSGS